jgi:hypothetical protein
MGVMGIAVDGTVFSSNVCAPISRFERLTGTFIRQWLGNRIGVLHPLATALVWMKVGTLVWRI